HARDDEPFVAGGHVLEGPVGAPELVGSRADQHPLDADRAEPAEPYSDGLPPLRPAPDTHHPLAVSQDLGAVHTAPPKVLRLPRAEYILICPRLSGWSD